MTAAGRIELARRSMRCTGCGVTAYPLDDRIGLDGFLSPGAARLACLLAADHSFAIAADRLAVLAGILLDDETIRRHCHEAAGVATARRETSAPPGFAAADGEVEFLTDGVMAPTRDGWREVKMTQFQRRVRGEPAEVAAWASRELPAPTVAAAYAAPLEAEAVAATWRPRAERLGIDPDGPLTILGDGAEWIRRADAAFPAAERILDIFHASGHIAQAANALFGEGSPEAADWLERARLALLRDGWPGLLDHIGATPIEGRSPAGQAGLDEMVSYFASRTDRLGYFGRLRTGRSIGSGAVEGLARRLGRRLKVAGRGWDPEHLERMATLIVTVDTPEWDQLWERPAA